MPNPQSGATVDQQLMASQLRQERKAKRAELSAAAPRLAPLVLDSKPTHNPIRTEHGDFDYRGQMRQARQQQNLRNKLNGPAKQGKLSKLSPTAAMRAGLADWLTFCWLNIIDSFGLTLIWVNIHAFLSLVIGDKIFCKLGHEWAYLETGGLPAQLPPHLQRLADKVGDQIHGPELGLMFLLDAIALGIIVLLFVLVILIINVVDFLIFGWFQVL